jgi:hypothetical protein
LEIKQNQNHFLQPCGFPMSTSRRNVRLRREYLYRKNLEGKEKEVYEKKKRIVDAVAGLSPPFPPLASPTRRANYSLVSIFSDGKSLPTELRSQYNNLKRDIDLDDAKTAGEEIRKNLFALQIISNVRLFICRSAQHH